MFILDKEKWLKNLSKPNWYDFVMADFDMLESIAAQETDYANRKALKNQAYQIIEDALNSKTINLAGQGADFDSERQAIDTVVIHHTANQPGMSLQRLNAIQLLRIYARHFYKDKTIKGQAVWSGHFYHGQPVFWVYHWLIRANGSTVRLLDDKSVGWHAGNWNTNCRSIGICFDDDLLNKEPTSQALQAATDIIAKYPNAKIIGHKESNPNTGCPGQQFDQLWKSKLIL